MAEGEKKKRRSPERTGPIVRRELTQVRDEVLAIRNLLENAANLGEAYDRADKLYTKLDRMDLRFKLHHDKSSVARGGGSGIVEEA